MTENKLVVDACCLINLDASGQLIEIVKCLPFSVVVSDIVWKEEITTLEQIKGEAGQAINTKLIEVVDMREDELEMFIQYAAQMGDDGESATFAIAVNRGWSVATDDKGAINFLLSLKSKTHVLSTLELIQLWAKQQAKSSSAIRQVLLQIKEKGRYIPGKSHPLYTWWESFMKI